jgi:hypothetical protein
MATDFAPGRYLVRVENQCFTESQQKKTLGFRLTFRVQTNLDEPDARVKPFSRDITWWISEKNFKRVLQDLHTLGYAGDSLAGVDPDSKSFHGFFGQEIELACTHETGEKGGVFERWGLPADKPVGQPGLKDKSRLQRFDQILARSQGHRNDAADDLSQGITDADVPF